MQIPVLRISLQVFKCIPALVMLTLHACQDGERVRYINNEASVPLPQMPFEPEQAVLLNQYATPSSRTTSWVLADSTFIHNHSLVDFFEVSGEGKLCILHWSQANDPVWIGARIPGRFLGADLMMYENNKLVIRQYKPNAVVTTASESYRKEIEGLLKQIDPLRYP